MTSTQVLFLGTGTSVGVPIVNCTCRTCTSSDPHDWRLNTAIVLIRDGFYLLVDAGPDFRHSALKFKLPRVDAVWLTHTHFDHYAGLDYLRIYNYAQKSSIPLYGFAEHLNYLKTKALSYLFTDQPSEGGGISQLELHPLTEPTAVNIGPFAVQPIPVLHGKMPVWNIRVDNFAYVTDCNHIPADSMDKLKNLHTLVLSALRYQTHRTHFSVEQSVAITRQLQPQQAYFTHFTHDIHHQTLLGELSNLVPEFVVRPAYDGLKINV